MNKVKRKEIITRRLDRGNCITNGTTNIRRSSQVQQNHSTTAAHKLELGGEIGQLNEAFKHFVPSKMAIYFYVFCPSMEDKVLG